MCVCVHECAWVYACVHACMHVYVCMCLCVCVHVSRNQSVTLQKMTQPPMSAKRLAKVVKKLRRDHVFACQPRLSIEDRLRGMFDRIAADVGVQSSQQGMIVRTAVE